jgi:cyclin B
MVEAPGGKLKSGASHSLKNLAASTSATAAAANPSMTLRSAFGDLGNKIANNNQQQQQQQHQKALKSAIPVKKEKVFENAALVKKEKVDSECVKMDISEIGGDEVATKPSHVIDIDENDADNPLLLADYVKDVYVYLMSLEKKVRIAPAFLDGKLVTAKMRSVLVDWLIQVHLKFHLLQETLYLCVQIIDAYLQVEDVSKMQLQLVGVTAMFLASKYEEMYVPTIEDFVYMTDNTYTKSEIRRMEIKILQALNFMFGRPLPLAFLRRFSKAGPVSRQKNL